MGVRKVLKLIPGNMNDQRLTLKGPKSGNEAKMVFIPRNIADRLSTYTGGYPLLRPEVFSIF